MRGKRRALMGVVGALGVVILVAGFVGGTLEPRGAITWAFAVWVLGSTLVILFTDPPEKARRPL